MGRLEALAAVRTAVDHISRLEGGVWEVVDDLSSLRLRSNDELGAGDVRDALDPLLHLALGGELVGSSSGFRLSVSSDGFALAHAPQTPADYFSGEDLSVAMLAAEGEADAALNLPERWSVTADFDLADPLRNAEPTVHWRVLRHVDVLASAVHRLPWWQTSQPLRDPDRRGRHTRYVTVDDSEADYTSPMCSVVPLDSAFEDIPRTRVVDEELTRPESLWPVTPGDNGNALTEAIASRATALAWARLADGFTPTGTAGRLEFFGFRRIVAEIPPEGITSRDAQKSTAELYKWASQPSENDRLLAVRQVCSLYPDDGFVERAADVLRAAEPIYAGLRREAVAEVFAAQREARTVALTASRQAADAALTAAKSVGERTLAAVAGIGGIAVARAASTPVDAALAANLLLGVSVYTALLALWSIFVEGPTMTASLSSLEADLKVVGDILTTDQRREIAKQSLVVASRRRVWVVRVAAPLAYAAVAVVALVVR